MSLPRISLALLAGLFVTVPLRADGPAATGPSRKPALDAQGDPLPEFASARLGTTRFRNGVAVETLRFTADSRSLVTFDLSKIARVWDVSTGKERFHFPLPPSGDWRLTPDARVLVSTAEGPELRAYDAATGKVLQTFKVEGSVLTSACLTPDGKTLAAVATHGDTEKRIICFWDLTSGKQLATLAPTPAGENNDAFLPALLSFAAGGKALAVMGGLGGQMAVRFYEFPRLTELTHQPLIRELGGDFMERSKLSPDGKLILTMDVDREKETVILWLVETATGKKLRTIEPLPERLDEMVFSPDGQTLLVREVRGQLQLYDVNTGKPRLAPPLAGTDGVLEYTFSSDGRMLAYTTVDGLLHLWDIANARVLHRFQREPQKVEPRMVIGQFLRGQRLGMDARLGPKNLAFSDDGKLVAAVADGNRARLWRVDDGMEVKPGPTGHEGPVVALAIAPDGKTVVSAAEDGTVRLWDPATSRELRRLTIEANDKEVPEKPLCLAFTPDGKRVAAGTDQGTVQLWETATGKPQLRIRCTGSVRTIAFTPDGRRLAAGDRGAVCWLDASTGRRLHRFSDLPPAAAEAEDARELLPEFTAELSPCGRLLAAAGSHSGQVDLWETTTGKLRRRLQGSESSLAPEVEGIGRQMMLLREFNNRHASAAPLLAFSADGKALACMWQELIQLHDVSTGRELRSLGGQAGIVTGMAFSPTSRILAASSHDGTVRLWDPANATILGEVRTDRGWLQTVRFSPDCATLLTAGSDSTVLLWDVRRVLEARRAVVSPPTAREAEQLWERLASAQADEAGEAVNRLATAPAAAVALARQRLRPIAAVDTARMERLLADLSGDQFGPREQASAELAKVGELAEPFLRRCLERNPPAEVRQRVDLLLEKLTAFVDRPEEVRSLRAVELLERIGTAEARGVLEALAKGTPDARLTREAQAALDRLAGR